MPTQKTAPQSNAAKLNVRLLRKIQRHILEEPRRFFMSEFIALGEPGKRFAERFKDLSEEVPPCGTAACIAGWALLLSNRDVPEDGADAAFEAAELLGIEKKDSPDNFASWGFRWLMNANFWPEPFKTRYAKAETPSERATVAVERIEHLIATKGVE